MQVLDSIIDGALALPNRREGDELIGKMVRYLRTGEEPETKGVSLAYLTGVMPVLVRSRKLTINGSKGGSASKRQSEAASKRPSKDASKRTSKTASKPPSKDASKRPTEEEEEEEEELGRRTKDKGGARFRAPSPDEVRSYASEKGLAVDAERFCDFYASKGWKVGKSPMKDWQAAARNWSKRETTGEAKVDATRFEKYR
jgi:hypothetical protein